MHTVAVEYAEFGGFTLRSGGARGADTAFEEGCDDAGGRKEIYRPEDATPEAIKHAAEFHPNWYRCSPYTRKLHGRNSMIVLGKDLDDPVEVVICWTPNGAKVGGTAQALRIAEHHKIPIINLGATGAGRSR